MNLSKVIEKLWNNKKDASYDNPKVLYKGVLPSKTLKRTDIIYQLEKIKNELLNLDVGEIIKNSLMIEGCTYGDITEAIEKEIKKIAEAI